MFKLLFGALGTYLKELFVHKRESRKLDEHDRMQGKLVDFLMSRTEDLVMYELRRRDYDKKDPDLCKDIHNLFADMRKDLDGRHL